MGVAEKKSMKIIIFSHINAPFTLLPGRNGARFLMRYNEPFPIFLSFLVRQKNALLHFPAISDKREREHTSVRMGKTIHLSSSRNRP